MSDSVVVSRQKNFLLRPYQCDTVQAGSRLAFVDGKDVLFEGPTGSGKTLEGVTLLGLGLGTVFTHAIVIAPQRQIEEGFIERNGTKIRWPSGDRSSSKSISIPPHFLRAARHGDEGSVLELLSYLSEDDPGYVLVCTHAALNYLASNFIDQLPGDLSNRLLLVDEAHHAPANRLSRIVLEWRKRSGRLMFFTATPYRADGRPVCLPGMVLIRRSLSEHMEGGVYAPARIEHAIVPFGDKGDHVTPAQFRGDATLTRHNMALAMAIVDAWVADGRPKSIVRIPPISGGSASLVRELIGALSAHGARVLDATGVLLADQQRFLSALSQERNRDYLGSQYDVIVGIQRVLEGTDWPLCSTIYCVGFPGSLPTVVQLIGRAMRPKGGDHPERSRARIVFFVPNAGGDALQNLAFEHSCNALLTCVFLADHRVGSEWIVTREVFRGIRSASDGVDDMECRLSAAEALSPIDPKENAEVRSLMMAIVERRGVIPVSEVLEDVAASLPHVSRQDLERIAVEVLSTRDDVVGERVRDSIRSNVSAFLAVHQKIRPAVVDAFRAVVEEFRSETIGNRDSLGLLRQQVHSITGGKMKEFVDRIRNSIPAPLTKELLRRWVEDWTIRTGRRPHRRSGEIPDTGGRNWATIHSSLYDGCWGFPKKYTLAKFIDDEFGESWYRGLYGNRSPKAAATKTHAVPKSVPVQPPANRRPLVVRRKIVLPKGFFSLKKRRPRWMNQADQAAIVPIATPVLPLTTDPPIPAHPSPDQFHSGGNTLRHESDSDYGKIFIRGLIAKKEVLTTGDIAKLCKVAPRTVSKWIDQGLLSGYRIPGGSDRRVRAVDLIAFMDKNGF